MDDRTKEKLQGIPQVQKLLDTARVRTLLKTRSHDRVVKATRAALASVRDAILAGEDAGIDETSILDRVEEALSREARPSLKRVLNATGIVIHTNLGRAPLGPEVVQAIADTAGYSNLEYDVSTGKRGSRYVHVEGLLRELTGAEASIVVNNNAAAVMLAINSMADGSEVVISRGELVEIGGSFRIPDVITRSGAAMVEVGATNKTHLADFENAMTENTAALLRVHPSNFKMLGFTGSTSREDLVALAREHDVCVIEDLGSGTLVDLAQWGLPHEDTVQEVLAAGVDLVTFSGDKLLGGPQAGIVCGTAELVGQMKKNPLLRAMRIDKLSLAALEATLRAYLDPDRLTERLPALRMLAQTVEVLEARARSLAEALGAIGGVSTEVAAGHGYSGGGALPDEKIPTMVVRVTVSDRSPDSLASALRERSLPVIGRISNDRFCLDMRTVGDDEVELIVEAFRGLVP